MKKNKKGFTLIELLAVIVILAIIALIAVPVVMNIITRARRSAAADSAYAILSAAELYYADQLLESPTTAIPVTVFAWGDSKSEGELDGLTTLNSKGTKPTRGEVTLDSDGNAFIGLAQTPVEEGQKVTYEGSLEINGFTCGYTTGSTTTITCS